MAYLSSPGRRCIAALVGLASAMTLSLSACSSGGGGATDSSLTPKPAEVSGDITLWHFFTDREADVIQTAVDNFETAYPNIHVNVVSGQDDDKMRQAIQGGQAIDVGISYAADQIGVWCPTGAFVDLQPYIDRDNVDISQVPALAQSYTQYKGTRCALPMLADAYALYYNTDLFQAAGITTPPKTLDEFADDAVKLTTYNADGSINTLGFMPLMGYYETNESTLSAAVQATFLNDDGTSSIGSDANWQTLFNWQKDLIDRLGGYQKLSDWQAGLGEEFSAQNDFQTGRVAMELDGEYRTAFIDDQAPDLHYATAPTPTSSDHTDVYGAGYVTGNVIGIPKTATNPEAAWLLVQYLALNTDAQVQMGNGLKNVPTISSALTSPDLDVSTQYQTFLDVYANAKSVTAPSSPIGTGYLDTFRLFTQDWESGAQTDLAAGLSNVDSQINAAIQLGG